MDPLLGQKYEYIIFEPIDSVKAKLKWIVKSPWYDLAINFTGRVFEDNTFKLYPKMTIGFSSFGMVQHIAMISGKLETDNGKTSIKVEIKPPIMVLLSFYVTLFIFVCKALGLYMYRTQEDWIIIIGLFFILIFFRSLIYFSVGRLKNRFERIMGVHPEE